MRALPILICCMIGCGTGSTSDVVQRTDSAGVTIVRNTSPDRQLDWAKQEVLRLGGKEEGPESFFRISHQRVATDSDGRLYVLDGASSVVHLFHTNGKYLRSVGREGGGPGEFRSAYALFVSDTGIVQVLDGRKQAFVRFGADGAIMPEMRLPQGVYVSSTPVLIDGVGLVSIMDSIAGGGGEFEAQTRYRSIVRFRQAGDAWSEATILAAHRWQRPASNDVGVEPCAIHSMLPIFSVTPRSRATPDHLLYAYTAEYVVEVDTYDGIRTSIRRAQPVRAATRSLAAQEIGPMGGPEPHPCNQTAESRADQAMWADVIPWVVDFAMSPGGELWVLRRAPGEEVGRRVDVFAEDGTYRGTLPPAFDLPVAWRGEDEVVYIETDDVGLPYVVVYRLIQPRG